MSLFSRLRKLRSLSQAKSHIQKFWRAWRAVRPEFTFCMQARRMRTQSSERLLLRIWLDKVMHGLLQSRYWWSNQSHFLTSYHSQYCFCIRHLPSKIYFSVQALHFPSNRISCFHNSFSCRLCIPLIFQMVLLVCSWQAQQMRKLTSTTLCKSGKIRKVETVWRDIIYQEQ